MSLENKSQKFVIYATQSDEIAEKFILENSRKDLGFFRHFKDETFSSLDEGYDDLYNNHLSGHIQDYIGKFFPQFRDSPHCCFRHLFCVLHGKKYKENSRGLYKAEITVNGNIFEHTSGFYSYKHSDMYNLIILENFKKSLEAENFLIELWLNESHINITRENDGLRTEIYDFDKKIQYAESYPELPEINRASVTVDEEKILKISFHWEESFEVYRHGTSKLENLEKLKQNILEKFPNFLFTYTEIQGKYIENKRIVEHFTANFPNK